MLLVQVKWPAVIVGSSIGTSTAIDFALHHPEATAKLALLGPAAWNQGLSFFPLLPRWLAQQIIKVQVSLLLPHYFYTLNLAPQFLSFFPLLPRWLVQQTVKLLLRLL